MEEEKVFIGALSKETNVPIKTIRYYEELGLLENAERTNAKYRLYSRKDIDKLLFIKKAKELGLTLADIKSIISCSREGLRPCCDFVQNLFKKKIDEYENKISELKNTKKRLENKLRKWIDIKKAKKMKYDICPQIGVKTRGKKI